MKFSKLLIEAIERSEIPLRFEPGAAEAVASPVTEFVRAWIAAHAPDRANGDFERGQQSLIDQLLGEIDDWRTVG
jgi:hypothetical protein